MEPTYDERVCIGESQDDRMISIDRQSAISLIAYEFGKVGRHAKFPNKLEMYTVPDIRIVRTNIINAVEDVRPETSAS